MPDNTEQQPDDKPLNLVQSYQSLKVVEASSSTSEHYKPEFSGTSLNTDTEQQAVGGEELREQLAKQALPILHRYKYGKTAMQSGKTMRRTEGHDEALQVADVVLQLISRHYIAKEAVADIEARIEKRWKREHDYYKDMCERLLKQSQLQLEPPHIVLKNVKPLNLDSGTEAKPWYTDKDHGQLDTFEVEKPDSGTSREDV